MKKSDPVTFLGPIVAACLLLAGRSSHAQTLEVHESGGGLGTVTKWQKRSGSYGRDYHQTKKLRIIVRDMTRHSPDGEVHVYFIGRKQPQLDLFIYNNSTINVHFGGELEVTKEIDAPSLYEHETYYRWENERSYSGASMEGWIAQGFVGSRLFDTVASNQNLLAIAKSDALQKMIAAAHIHEPEPPAEGSTGAIQTAPKSQSRPETAVLPMAQTTVVNRRIPVQTAQGEIIIPSGTQVRVLGREGENLQVSYMGWTLTIPASATDLK